MIADPHQKIGRPRQLYTGEAARPVRAARQACFGNAGRITDLRPTTLRKSVGSLAGAGAFTLPIRRIPKLAGRLSGPGRFAQHQLAVFEHIGGTPGRCPGIVFPAP